MFEEMRGARKTRRIIGSPDMIPDHMGDDRRAMIGDHDELHAVLQGELNRFARSSRRRRERIGWLQAFQPSEDSAPGHAEERKHSQRRGKARLHSSDGPMVSVARWRAV